MPSTFCLGLRQEVHTPRDLTGVPEFIVEKESLQKAHWQFEIHAWLVGHVALTVLINVEREYA